MAERQTVRFTLVAMLTLLVGGGGRGSAEVVVYTSVDDVFARPVAEQFEQATGIVVRLVPDTEEIVTPRDPQSGRIRRSQPILRERSSALLNSMESLQ